MGTLDAPYIACPPIDMAVDCASLMDPVVAPMTLPLASSAALDGSWRALRRARVFFGSSFRRVPHPPTLWMALLLDHGKKFVRNKRTKNSQPTPTPAVLC